MTTVVFKSHNNNNNKNNSSKKKRSYNRISSLSSLSTRTRVVVVVIITVGISLVLAIPIVLLVRSSSSSSTTTTTTITSSFQRQNNKNDSDNSNDEYQDEKDYYNNYSTDGLNLPYERSLDGVLSIRLLTTTTTKTKTTTTTDTDVVVVHEEMMMPAIGYGTCCRKSSMGDAIYQSTKTYLTLGGRLIDTAMAYNNHIEIGNAIKEQINNNIVTRDELWITSKIAPNRVKTYQDTLNAVDRILKELQLSYIDLLLIHSPKLGKQSTIQLWKGLIEAKRLNKVRVIGVSNHNLIEIKDLGIATGIYPTVNQIQLHPWSPIEWKQQILWGNKHGMTIIAYTSLGGSRFHTQLTSNSEGDHHHHHSNENWPDVVVNLANKYMATPAQVLLYWSLRQGVAVIPGSGSEIHIKENLNIPYERLKAMTDDEALSIERVNAPYGWFDAKRGVPYKMSSEEAKIPWIAGRSGKIK